MRLLICGSRTLGSYQLIDEAIKESGFKPTEVITGGAYGVDYWANLWAKENGIDQVIMPANWKRDGKAAGPIRNKKMVQRADAILAIWDGKSKGTQHAIHCAAKEQMLLFVFRV